MDSYEATKMVFSRIQSLDPENASKIMGYLLLQDHGDKEMIRLAFGPETLLHNLIHQAKTSLGFTSSSPSPFNPTSSPRSISSSRFTNNSFEITNPSSPSSSSWPLFSPNSTYSSFTYAGIVNGTSNPTSSNSNSSSLSSTVSLSNAFPCYNSNNTNNTTSNSDLIDEYQLENHFAFLNDSKTDDLFDPWLDSAMSPTAYDTNLHRRCCSVPGMSFGSEDTNSAGLGWKPCLYFAKGFCKNGPSCRFLHGNDSADGATFVGSPSKFSEFELCQELLRSKAAAARSQKLVSASQFVVGAASFPYNKCMNLLLQQQNDNQRAGAALMMGDELHKFGRCRPERYDFSPMALAGAMNPCSRQIYLTFPADSSFREEDVSNYFSIYGPVQDVRIPYQQKRMFGFVTFVYPETVKLILAKGNPHFVCDSRVLVKPYKEKGKFPDKKQPHNQKQIERGHYSACSSPSAVDSREPLDYHLGVGMFQNTPQEMLLRRKLEEQAELQQAIELQGRMLNLQLFGSSAGSQIPSPTLSRTSSNRHTLMFQPDGIDQEIPEEKCGNPDVEVNSASNHSNGDCNISSSCSTEEKKSSDHDDLDESLEDILPESLFASPKKSAHEHTVFSTAALEVEDNAITSTTSSFNCNLLLPTTSSLNITPLKSCFLQMPRFSSGHGITGM